MASILITSAPNSASMRAANGAAISVPISITLIALKGAVIAGYLLFLEYVPRLEDRSLGNPTFSWQRAFAKCERSGKLSWPQVRLREQARSHRGTHSNVGAGLLAKRPA
ncbi:hypothetical protein D3C73_834440 [compost metagenome]